MTSGPPAAGAADAAAAAAVQWVDLSCLDVVLPPDVIRQFRTHWDEAVDLVRSIRGVTMVTPAAHEVPSATPVRAVSAAAGAAAAAGGAAAEARRIKEFWLVCVTDKDVVADVPAVLGGMPVKVSVASVSQAIYPCTPRMEVLPEVRAANIPLDTVCLSHAPRRYPYVVGPAFPISDSGGYGTAGMLCRRWNWHTNSAHADTRTYALTAGHIFSGHGDATVAPLDYLKLRALEVNASADGSVATLMEECHPLDVAKNGPFDEFEKLSVDKEGYCILPSDETPAARRAVGPVVERDLMRIGVDGSTFEYALVRLDNLEPAPGARSVFVGLATDDDFASMSQLDGATSGFVSVVSSATVGAVVENSTVDERLYSTMHRLFTPNILARGDSGACLVSAKTGKPMLMMSALVLGEGLESRGRPLFFNVSDMCRTLGVRPVKFVKPSAKGGTPPAKKAKAQVEMEEEDE